MTRRDAPAYWLPDVMTGGSVKIFEREDWQLLKGKDRDESEAKEEC